MPEKEANFYMLHFSFDSGTLRPEPGRPTMGGGPSEHDMRQAQKLK
jgi:hypothetical protein